MKHYKQKTVALVLASVLTVVGTFASSNYKNSIMSLKFEVTSNDAVNMTIFTKTNYNNNIIPIKRDAHTFVIMLPETNSQIDGQLELDKNIESVDIRTMPYTNTAKGYTKITVKTLSNTQLSAKNALFIPEIKKENKESQPDSNNNNANSAANENINASNTPTKEKTDKPLTENTSDPVKINSDKIPKNSTNSNVENKKNEKDLNETTNIDSTDNANTDSNDTNYTQNSDNSLELLYLIFGILLVISVSAYLFIKGNNKILEIIGEQVNYSTDDSESKTNKTNKNERRNKIRKTINKLDKMYQKPVQMPLKSSDTAESFNENVVTEDVIEQSNFVDLDELFLEQTKSTNIQESKNDNLDDFLADFFGGENEDEERFEYIQKNKEIDEHNNELLDKLLNSQFIEFTKDDIENINNLINVEISDEFLNAFRQYYEMSKKTLKNNSTGLGQRKSLEQMILELFNVQNIYFTTEDVDALNAIMNVELDSDFVTNLQTNPILSQQMENRILNEHDRIRRKKEMKVLNVKDRLPDLAKELAKIKKIESNAKPQTIFFEQGYDVNTLVIDNLPDLSDEIKKHSKDEYVPSVDIVIKDERWKPAGGELTEINVASELPDLEDVKAHPKKYEDKKPKVKVNEKELLKNLNSVVFKPFYDGNETEEINKSETIFSFDENNDDDILLSNIDDKNILDFDKIENIEELVPDISETIILEEKSEKKSREKDSQTEDLLNLIDEKQQAKKQKNIIKNLTDNENHRKIDTKKENTAKAVPTECTINGIKYSIISAVEFVNNMGCYLANNEEEGYSILGFIGDNIFEVKHYKQIKNSKIQARVSEKFDNGTFRYIIRIGIHKFILDVTDDKMEYVMDLC